MIRAKLRCDDEFHGSFVAERIGAKRSSLMMKRKQNGESVPLQKGTRLLDR